MQAGFVSKLCGRYAAVNPVFVSLVIGVVRTNPYWQQFHGVTSALYLLAVGRLGSWLFLASIWKSSQAFKALLSPCASAALCE